MCIRDRKHHHLFGAELNGNINNGHAVSAGDYCKFTDANLGFNYEFNENHTIGLKYKFGSGYTKYFTCLLYTSRCV